MKMEHFKISIVLALIGFVGATVTMPVFCQVRYPQKKVNKQNDERQKKVFLPLKQLYPTSPYGWRIHPLAGKKKFHSGIDLRACKDTVYAVFYGTVLASGFDIHLGNFIRIEHGVFQSTYGHLSKNLLGCNMEVNSGTPIAITGNTGYATGEHLHFSIRFHNTSINPLKFLQLLTLSQKLKND